MCLSFVGRRMHMRVLIGCVLLLSCLASGEGAPPPKGSISRVLLLSIDGLHALDLANYVEANPRSTLARLTSHGVTYTNAQTSLPSNSWPGLLALVTGGSPISTGVIFENSYDHNLSPPGSNCGTRGTKVVYDSSIDRDSNAIDGGGG